jgi:hypothetical protein
MSVGGQAVNCTVQVPRYIPSVQGITSLAGACDVVSLQKSAL